MTSTIEKTQQDNSFFLRGLGVAANDNLVIPKQFLRLFDNDFPVAILLSRVIYLFDKLDVQEVTLTPKQLVPCCLTEKQRKRVAKKLKNLGILIVERKGLPSKNYYSINYSKLADLLVLKGLHRGDKKNLPVSPKGTDILISNNISNNISKDKQQQQKEIQEIYKSFREKIKKGSRVVLTEQSKNKIKTRLKEYSKEELLEGIDRFSKNKWRMENNSDKTLTWFFRSNEQIETFLSLKLDLEEQKIASDNFIELF